jgi:hypothetical protein
MSRRIVKLDAQGREELMRAVRETNARFREIEDDYAERSGEDKPIFPGIRVIALPASDEQIAEAQAAEAHKRGTPPL